MPKTELPLNLAVSYVKCFFYLFFWIWTHFVLIIASLHSLVNHNCVCDSFYVFLFSEDSILFYSILFYSIMFYSVLFYSISILFYSVLFYIYI